jgi:hypothetical protein
MHTANTYINVSNQQRIISVKDRKTVYAYIPCPQTYSRQLYWRLNRGSEGYM